MAEAVNTSKKTGGDKMINIEHVLDLESFITFFTVEGCTYEEKLVQEILRCICGLRNSGGGKLTLRLTKTCTASEIEKCVEIIQDAAENILSNTNRADCVVKKSMNRVLIFSIRGSEEIVTMKYNMYVMENDEVKLVSSTRSAADVRRLLQKRRGESVLGAKGCDQRKIIEYQTRSKEEPIPRTEQFGHGKNVENRTSSKEEPVPRTKEFDHGKNVEDRAGSQEEPGPTTKKTGHGKKFKDRAWIKEATDPRTKEFGHGKNVEDRTRSKEEPVPKTNKFDHGKNVEDRAGSQEEPGPTTKEFDHGTLVKVHVGGLYRAIIYNTKIGNLN